VGRGGEGMEKWERRRWNGRAKGKGRERKRRKGMNLDSLDVPDRSTLWPPRHSRAALYAFALWAWPRFLTNSSAPVQWSKKWLSDNILRDTCSV
jgi:hypothetical protein